MATIIHLESAERSVDTGRDDRTRSWLVGSMLLVLALVLGVPTIGLAVTVIFAVGVTLAHLERRPLRPVEFVAIATLHAAAVVLLAF